MSDKPKRFELQKGLYAVDSSGSAPDRKRLKRRADKVYEEVKASYDEDAMKVISTDEESDD